MTERFQIKKVDDNLILVDERDKLNLDTTFKETDKEWLLELVDFLNLSDVNIQTTILKYGRTVYDLNNLKKTIAETLEEELKDCELLFDVDEEDLYTQGRLIEIHNLMKILIS